jgi:hypothetical protein
MICNLYMNLMSINALWSMSSRMLCLHMFAQHVVLYGPPWVHYLGGYQDRLLGGPLGLLDLCCTALDGVKHKDYRGEVLG